MKMKMKMKKMKKILEIINPKNLKMINVLLQIHRKNHYKMKKKLNLMPKKKKKV